MLKLNIKMLQETVQPCLLCSSSPIPILDNIFDARFGIKGIYSITRCPNCGLEQTSPLPSVSELKQLYENHYNFDGETDTAYTRLRQRLFSSFLYQLWLAIDGDISFHLMKGTGRLLDIGCNEGRGLQLYQQNGFEVEGLELNENAAEIARSQGFKVHTQLLQEFQPHEPYDVVILSNVLEHSLNPHEMLIQVNQILKPGGKICISCPNSRSWLRTLFGRFWINWHVPFHIVHFSKDSLSQLLKETSFQSIRVKEKTPSLWVSHSLIAKLYAKQGTPTKQMRTTVLVAPSILVIRILLFPILWLGNILGSGDCLVVTAYKKEAHHQ
jgi:2-polyprenyl-3-methyl-5-hydroxy-6-metoxy-1,4-benzoquinol methylase